MYYDKNEVFNICVKYSLLVRIFLTKNILIIELEVLKLDRYKNVLFCLGDGYLGWKLSFNGISGDVLFRVGGSVKRNEV